MKKQNIGILSFSNYKMINYGGILQAYALRNIIEKLDCDCSAENINFNPESNYYHSKKQRFISTVYQKVFAPIFNDRKRRRRTIDFYNQYMFKNGYETNKPGVEKYINSHFDKLIIGSDQVLNPYINNYCDLYLGKNINIKKYLYAASFGGNTLDKKWSNDIVINFPSFQKLSFREETGLTLSHSLGFKGRVDLDPTLLVQKEEWCTLVNSIQLKLPEKYIFCYIMPGNKKITKTIKNTAKKISKITKYKILYCGQKDYMRLFEPMKNRSSFGPMEWIKAIQLSSFVVTNSFHGTAFSINFNKPFIAYTTVKNSQSSTNFSSRIYDLTNKLNLSEFVNPISDEIIEKAINYCYNKTNISLDKYRNLSLDYIKEILND